MIVAGLHLAGKKALVVGAGAIGTRRVRALIDDGADLTVVSPHATEAVRRFARDGQLRWEERTVRREDVDGAWFVVAATDNPTVNRDVCLWADEQHAWCINASDALAGTARMAAASKHGEVVIGVASLAEPDPGKVRRVRDELAATVDRGEVSLRSHRPRTGKVMLVGAGPGAADLLTVRARAAIASADVIIHDRLGTSEILGQIDPEVLLVDVGKSPHQPQISQAEINQMLVLLAREDKFVVRLKGGDPFVFGRGGEEAHACIEAGVPFEVVPGITSAVAVPGFAGIPVTHRGVSAAVHIATAHGGVDEAALAAMRAGATVVLLMGVGALEHVAASAASAGVEMETPVAIIENGSLASQRITRGTLSSIVRIASETAVKSPAVIVIGTVARPNFLASSAASSE